MCEGGGEKPNDYEELRMTIIIDGKPVIYPDDLPVSLPRDRGRPREGEGSRGTYKVHAYRPRGARKAQWARVRQALSTGPRTHIDLRRAGGDALALLDAATLGDWAQRGLIERGEDRLWRLAPAGRAA